MLSWLPRALGMHPWERFLLIRLLVDTNNGILLLGLQLEVRGISLEGPVLWMAQSHPRKALEISPYVEKNVSVGRVNLS